MSAFFESSSTIFGATPESTLPRKEIRSVFNEQSKQRIKQLCESITREQDQHRFSLLINELDQLLEKLQASQSRGAAPASGSSSPIPSEPPPDPEC
jgi:hypothetical protein